MAIFIVIECILFTFIVRKMMGTAFGSEDEVKKKRVKTGGK
jgi:hypothetical protein